MKIAYTGYPLTQLLGGETQKKTGMCAQNGFLGRIDVPVLSNVPDKAVVKYLQAIDEILSEIIRLVDGDASPTGSQDIAAVSLSRDIARGLSDVGVGMGMKEEDPADPFANTAGVEGPPAQPGPAEEKKVVLFLSGNKGGQTVLQRVEKEGFKDTGTGAFIGPIDLPEKLPVISIRFIDPAGMGVSGAASGKKEGMIIESMTSLAAALNDIIGSQAGTEEGTDGAAVQITAAKTAVKEAVKEALKVALRYSQDGGAVSGDSGDPFGLRTDEKGLLRIDRTIFSEALTGRKDETARFVHGFGSSLHDRISYFFHPFAGLYVGAPDAAGLQGPGNKEGAADDGEDRKAGFEKRLGELQMLLKSSYELKESFMQKRFTDQGGPDEETCK